MSRQQSHIWMLGVGAFLAGVFGTLTLFFAPISYAALPYSVLESPNYPSYERLAVTKDGATPTTDTPLPTVLNQITHVLKSESSSTINQVDVGAYSQASLGGATFEITRPIPATTCQVTTNAATNGNNEPFITVIITYGSAKSVYKINHANVCTAGTKLNPNDTSQTIRNNGNQFYATYTIPTPAPLPPVDSNTQLYKATITIKYGDETRTLVGSASDQNVRFQVKLNPPCNPLTCHNYLEPLANGGGRNYSTLYANTSSGDFFSKQKFEFGLPCNMSSSSMRINVYDLDTGQDTNWSPVPDNGSGVYGRGGMYVEWYDKATDTWERLAKADYTSLTGGDRRTDVNFLGGDAIVQRTGSGVVTRFNIFMKAQTRYRLVLTPIKSKNLVGVGLPTDSIYGAIECSTVTRNPYFQVHGGDIMAGIMMGGVQNNSAIISSWFDEDANQGSSTELAAIASGGITGFATNVTDAAEMATKGNIKTLAFDNTDDPPGNFRAFPTGNNDYVGSAIAASQADGSWHQGNVADLWDLTGKKGTYQYGTAAAPVTAVVNATNNVAAGTTVTLVIYGNVYINSNLNYNPYSLATVPRLNIYATGNIIVDKNVGTLKGVFISQGDGAGGGGTFYTCGDSVTHKGYAYTDLTESSGCGNPLSIYGAVAAQNIVLGRLAGDIKGAAAESIYMSPELWLAQPSTPSSSFDSYLSLPPVL